MASLDTMTPEQKKRTYLHFDGEAPEQGYLSKLAPETQKSILADQRDKVGRYLKDIGPEAAKDPRLHALVKFANAPAGQYDSFNPAQRVALIQSIEKDLSSAVLATPAVAAPAAAAKTAAPAAPAKVAAPVVPAAPAPAAAVAPQPPAQDTGTAALFSELKADHDKKKAAAAQATPETNSSASDAAKAPAAPTVPSDPSVAAMRQTQALLHMFGAYPGEGPGSPAIDGVLGPRTRMALDAFADRVRKADPSVSLANDAEIAARLRVEAIAQTGLRRTAEGMRTSDQPLDRDIAREVEGFYANPSVARGMQPVLPISDVQRTVVGRYTAAPAVAARTAQPSQEAAGAAAAPTFEEPEHGFNDAGARLRPSSRASFQRAGAPSQSQAQTAPEPAAPTAAAPVAEREQKIASPRAAGPQTNPRRAETDAPRTAQATPESDSSRRASRVDPRAVDVMDALRRAPAIENKVLGRSLGQAYIEHLQQGRVRPNEPVLFTGSMNRQVYAAYMDAKTGAVYAKDVTRFCDPNSGRNPLVADIEALAHEGQGGLVDRTRIADRLSPQYGSPVARNGQSLRSSGNNPPDYLVDLRQGSFYSSQDPGRIRFRGDPDARAERDALRWERQMERDALREQRQMEREERRWEREMARDAARHDRQWGLGVRDSLRGVFSNAVREMDRDERRVVGPLVRPLADELSHTLLPLIPRFH